MAVYSGSQTLGEEFCNIVQIDALTNNLPNLYRRAISILVEVFSPRLCARLYARVRQHIAAVNERHASSGDQDISSPPSHPESRLTSIKKRLLCLLVTHLPNSLDRSTLDSFNTLHLAIFYLTGRYFTWSKRFSGITYVGSIHTHARQGSCAYVVFLVDWQLSDRLRPLRPDGLGRESPPSYEVLGVLMVIQLVIKVVASRRQAARRREQLRLASEPVAAVLEEKGRDDPEVSKRMITVDGRLIDEMMFAADDESEDEGGSEKEDEERRMVVEECPEGVVIDDVSDQVNTRRCTLCLGPRKEQTSLECGHLFCWKCLVCWVREKPECPLCRHSVHVAELLPLYNF